VAYLAADFHQAEGEILLFHASAGTPSEFRKLEAAITALAAANLLYDHWWRGREHDRIRTMSLDDAVSWSRALLEIEMARCANPADRIAAAEKYLERARDLEKFAKEASDAKKLTKLDLLVTNFCVADGEFIVLEVKTAGQHKRAFADAARARKDAARAGFQGWLELFRQGHASPEMLYQWSTDWRNATTATATNRAERVAAAEAHLARMKELQRIAREWVRSEVVSTWYLWATDYYCAEAEILLFQAKAQ
jgi:hypothetical protein